MDMYWEVRVACAEGMSQRQAARHFNVSRDSVRKILGVSVPPGYRRTAPEKRPKLDAVQGHVLEPAVAMTGGGARGQQAAHLAPCAALAVLWACPARHDSTLWQTTCSTAREAPARQSVEPRAVACFFSQAKSQCLQFELGRPPDNGLPLSNGQNVPSQHEHVALLQTPPDLEPRSILTGSCPTENAAMLEWHPCSAPDRCFR